VRPRADATEFDHFHPGKGSGVGHRCNVTQLPFTGYGLDRERAVCRRAHVSVTHVNIVTFANRRARDAIPLAD
jgi:hypothetical protein